MVYDFLAVVFELFVNKKAEKAWTKKLRSHSSVGQQQAGGENEVNCRFLPTIIWDPRNYLFSCKELTVYMSKKDTFLLSCPSKTLYTRQEEHRIKSTDGFERIIFIKNTTENAERFEKCNTTGLASTIEHVCDPETVKQGSSCGELQNKPFYQVIGSNINSETFVFSTSFLIRQNLNKEIGGSCAGENNFYPLKMKIIVCEDNDKACKSRICNTMSCYEKGCGVWSSWVDRDEFVWNGTQCLQKYTRTCDSSLFTCDGVNEEFRIAPSYDNCTFPKTDCLASSISPSPSIASSTNDAVASSIFSSMNCPSCACPSFPSLLQSTSTKNVETASCTKNASVNIITVNITKTIMQDQTINVTMRITETVKQTVTVTPPPVVLKSCTDSVSVVTPEVVYKDRDIKYDDKFYFTIISAVVGAILVGIFVTHACVAYRKGNKTKKAKVIQVQEYNNQELVVKTEQNTKVTHNGTYTKIGTSSPVN